MDCALLQEQTDYEVRVESDRSFLRRKWRVEGTTQKTAISPAILDHWVTWMVIAGKDALVILTDGELQSEIYATKDTKLSDRTSDQIDRI